MNLIAEDSFWLTICALGSSMIIALLGLVPVVLTPFYFSSFSKKNNAGAPIIVKHSSCSNGTVRMQRRRSPKKQRSPSTRRNRSVSSHLSDPSVSGDKLNASSKTNTSLLSSPSTSSINLEFIDLQKSEIFIEHYFYLLAWIIFYLQMHMFIGFR